MAFSFQINNRLIGPGKPAYIIAELSANHNQDYDTAVALVHAAKDAGADAVKLQTYTPDTITIDCDNDYFRIQKGTIWEGRNLYELYGEAYTPWEWQPELLKIAKSIDLDLFSSPFDSTAVEFLEKIGVPAYKVASFELVDIPLIRTIARCQKPVIMSTGMATYEEINEAVHAVRDEGNDEIALLKCTSAYPAPMSEINLRTICHLQDTFGVPVGLSDHTLGIVVPVAAVSYGACIIEKHFTLSRSTPGPDSTFSLEPAEFRIMVDSVREAEAAAGSVTYDITNNEEASRMFRRSLFNVNDLRKGETITRDHVRSIRPGHGLPPKYLDKVLGKKANRDLKRGTPLTWDYFE
ncbi:MAG: pseudaminic acid synthase [Methanoregula sp.]|nr:pseudaminic acid synthase [Methanoregula sp.]